MVTCIINAMEGSDVDIVCITGAFIQTDMVHGDHTVRVRLCGALEDLLVKNDTEKFTDNILMEVDRR